MTPWRTLSNTPQPDLVLAAFNELAMDQRGEPEAAMGEAQHVMGGGVLSFAIEHTGDLTNRGWKDFHVRNNIGYDYVFNKTEKVLQLLRRPYGFAREHRENMLSNMKYDRNPATFSRRVNDALLNYAAAHRNLTVYNYAQWLAREAAVALGVQDFRRAELVLTRLEELLNRGEDRWAIISTAHIPGSDGRPLPYYGPSWSRR